MTVLAAWPFLEARLTGEHAEHNLLDPPWRTPVRTATGAAGVALFLVLTLAGGNDVLAVILDVPVEGITIIFRVLLVVVPVVTWLIVHRLAREMRDRHAELDRAGQGEEPRSVLLVRNAAGGFSELEADR